MFPANQVHVMIDFETLGLRPNANIRSLGAVVFSPYFLPLEESFHQATNLDLPQYRRCIDPDTWAWWKQQEAEGNPMPTGQYYLQDVANNFRAWLHAQCPQPENLFIWSNGTDFDIPLLYSMFDDCNLTPNWNYNNVRDYRTLRKLFPNIAVPEFIGVKHVAVDDAWNEAKHCVEILNYVGTL